MSQYDGVISIDKFLGINRASDEHNTSIRYAYEGANFDTSLGGLKPMSKPAQMGHYDPIDPPESPYSHRNRIYVNGNYQYTVSLMFLHKRWSRGVSGIIPADSYTNAYVITVVDGVTYYRQKYENLYNTSIWNKLLLNGEETDFSKVHKFDWISYELNRLPPETLTSTICAAIHDESKSYSYFDLDKYEHFDLKSDTGTDAYYVDMEGVTHTLTVNTDVVRENSYDAPVDCLLMTNSDDGMYCIYCPLDSDTPVIVQVPVMPIGTIENIKFGCIARYAERIWGSGIDSDPDKYMYSAPFDPFNWEQNNIDPAEGAGDDQQPNWDGDKFVAMRGFGNSLVMFKRHGIWKLVGTNPTEFAVRKMYGEGTISEDTIAVNGSYIFFLCDDPELKRFDGSSSYAYMYQAAKDILRKPVNEWDYDGAVGRMCGNKYVLLDIYSDPQMLIYDTAENTLNVEKLELGCECIEADLDNLYGMAIKAIDHEDPDDAPDAPIGATHYIELYAMFPIRANPDDIKGQNAEVTWVSAWQDMGAKNVDKSGFIIYLIVESDLSIYGENPLFEIDVGIETERKLKTKTVQMKFNKMKRIRINNHGRQFKIHFHVDPSKADNGRDWRISTGVQIYQEYDAD